MGNLLSAPGGEPAFACAKCAAELPEPVDYGVLNTGIQVCDQCGHEQPDTLT